MTFTVDTIFSQTTFTFIGHGLWTIPTNWNNNSIPPTILSSGSTIHIYPSPGDSCILNVNQTIAQGASLNIQNAVFVVSSGAVLNAYGIVNLNGDNSVPICNQEWKVKNLDINKYRNGDLIPQVTDNIEWANLTTGAWCYYDNDIAKGAIYGKLYNWYAVNDPRGLAPVGWHIPSIAESSILSACLGGDVVAGDKMKEAGTTHWTTINTGTNSSGFTGIGGGFRDWNGSIFTQMLALCLFWNATAESAPNAWSSYLYGGNSTYIRDINNKHYGFSVRCLKD